MKYYFESPARVAALQAEAETWLGTPFRPHSKAKGRSGGVDCIHLCERIFVAIGLFAAGFTFPRLPMDYSMHQDNSIILEYLRGQGRAGQAIDPQSKLLASVFEEVGPDAEHMPGDLSSILIGKCSHHLCLGFDNRRLIHVFAKADVDFGEYQDATFKKRLETIFRARAVPKPIAC